MRTILTFLPFCFAVPHPIFNIIKAKRKTSCNLPSCNQKFELGEPICCIGHNTWFHVPCGIEYKVQVFAAKDFDFLRTKVDMFALDSDMAATFHKRLESRNPSIFSGVPGSGKSTSLVAFVNLSGPAVNEVFVYNTDIAACDTSPRSSPFLPRASLVSLPLLLPVAPHSKPQVGMGGKGPGGGVLM